MASLHCLSDRIRALRRMSLERQRKYNMCPKLNSNPVGIYHPKWSYCSIGMACKTPRAIVDRLKNVKNECVKCFICVAWNLYRKSIEIQCDLLTRFITNSPANSQRIIVTPVIVRCIDPCLPQINSAAKVLHILFIRFLNSINFMLKQTISFRGVISN